MITFPEFKQNWHRLKENEEDEILDVMGALLTPETKAAILADLDAPVEAAKEAWRQEHRDSIREYADRLPVGDPLRVAIEGTP